MSVCFEFQEGILNMSKKRATEFTCIGRAIGKGDTLIHQYLNADGIRLYSTPLGSKPRSSDIVGGIYKGEVDDVSAYGPGTWAYQGMHPVKKDVIEWEAADKIVEAEYRDLREKKKAKRQKKMNPAMYKALEPIRKAYRGSTSKSGRRAIIAEILEYISE